jgi:4-hydroxy-4-methyl-2-oxoglutarate aldolase
MSVVQDETLSDRLAACYTGVIHDVMRAAGLRDFILPPGIRPLDPTLRLAGPAFTVEGRMQDISDDESMLAWTGLLSKAPSGHVLVMQPNNREIAFMGELSAETLKFRGLRGVLIDGASRDTDFILKLGFPLWATHYTPLDIVGRWRAERMGEAVRMGGVTIRTGDYLCCDRDGAVVIPVERVEEITRLAEEAMAQENLVRKAILQGVDPKEAYLRYGKF